MNYLLDITSIITFISGITNTPEINHQVPKTQEQIEEERHDPTIPKLEKLFKDCNLHVTKLILDKTEKMVNGMGSEDEIKRLNEFKSRFIIVDDVLDIEGLDHMEDFKRTLFGTAKKNNFTVVTGNAIMVGQVNAKETNQNLDINVILHMSRCLYGNGTGKKSYKQTT
jgi:hypothetical protein